MSAWTRYESWWLDSTVSREKLAVFRTVFFLIVAIDAFMQISHAPRYGASDFNVTNLPLIGSVLPELSRAGMATVWLLQAYLAFRIAFGGATRSAMVLLCAAFGYGYFISQLDSYQHHFLLFLVLFLCCFVRWDRSEKLESAWPIRAILVTLSVLYVFAAISKLEASWIDGHTLYFQVKKPWLHSVITNFGDVQIEGGKLVDKGGYATAAALVVFIELFFAVGIHVRRLRYVVPVLGVAFHLGIEWSGFEIGLFSYFMCALYLLVLPDKLFGLARPAIDRLVELIASARKRLTGSWSASWIVAALCFAAAGMAIGWLSFPDMAVAVAATIAIGVFGVFERRRSGGGGKHRAVVAIAVTHLAACLAIAALNTQADTARDYHRYWAASLRQMGSLEKAVPIYERAVQLDTDFAGSHNSLANLYRRTGRHDQALEHYATAQRLEPSNWRPFAGEAMTHDLLENADQALAAAIKALALNPNHRESQQIKSKWSQ